MGSRAGFGNQGTSGTQGTSSTLMALLLSEADVRAVLSMDDLIRAMESALAAFSSGRVVQPVRTVLQVGPERAFFGVMPAYVAAEPAGALGAKLVTLFNSNAARGLPTHLATILLLDAGTGGLLALMDGRYITEARTAAVSAVSVARLAATRASVLAILGSGVQARSHLEALARVRPLEAVRVWSPSPEHRGVFAREMSPHVSASVLAVASAEEAVRGAELIVAATSSPRPVVESAWVAPGAHVVSVGACRPDQRELDPVLTARGRLFVDSRAAALVESGDVLMGIAEGRFGPDHIAGELGDVVLGRMPGRQTPEEITIFKSLGMAVEDVVAADLAYRRAVERGIGTPVSL